MLTKIREMDIIRPIDFFDRYTTIEFGVMPMKCDAPLFQKFFEFCYSQNEIEGITHVAGLHFSLLFLCLCSLAVHRGKKQDSPNKHRNSNKQQEKLLDGYGDLSFSRGWSS